MSVCVGCCWLLSANTTPPNMAAATSQHEPARPDEYRLLTLTRMSTYVAGGHVGPSCRLVCPATRHGRHVGRRCWLVCRQSARIDRGRNRATAVNSNYPLSSITALRDRIFFIKKILNTPVAAHVLELAVCHYHIHIVLCSLCVSSTCDRCLCT